MKRRGPSNVFNIPKWMQNLRVREPEGKRTPDQVASSLELSILLHGACPVKLEAIVTAAVPTVPLERQPFLKALLKGDVVANCQAFIDEVNTKLALLPKEEVQNDREQEQCIEPSRGRTLDHEPDRWGDDDDLPVRRKQGSRRLRALRAAKRGQAET